MPCARVEITHPDRVLFPEDGITKGELADYYGEVAEAILPHLRGRALTVQRFLRGIGEPGFVQQDFADSLPDWMGRVEVAKEGGGTVVHPLAGHPEALRWLASQSCITLHAWQSRRVRLNHPDRLVFDLDPTDADFAVVRATARAVAGVLQDLGLVSYVQTTAPQQMADPAAGRADVVDPQRDDRPPPLPRRRRRPRTPGTAGDRPGRRRVALHGGQANSAALSAMPGQVFEANEVLPDPK
ncbi:hypothetical protein [Mycobacterium servetii]|uniref:DNA ligase D polymerase domain-containing protein n=1 Tax=Mycobacterium servetii TaxID=3237418 RepID=A0ABV4C6Z8_9MYCO